MQIDLPCYLSLPEMTAVVSSNYLNYILLAVLFTYFSKQNGIQSSTQGKEEGKKG